MDIKEIQEKRGKIISSTITEFKKLSLTTGERAKFKYQEAERLRLAAAALEAEGREISLRFAAEMDKIASKVRLPLQENGELEVAPWLKGATSAQLILAIGDDEWVTCDAPSYIPHHWGKPSESGHRFCEGDGTPDHPPHGPVVLESYNLAVFGEPTPPPVPSGVEVKDDSRKQG